MAKGEPFMGFHDIYTLHGLKENSMIILGILVFIYPIGSLIKSFDRHQVFQQDDSERTFEDYRMVFDSNTVV
jgi:hypothetical protein